MGSCRRQFCRHCRSRPAVERRWQEEREGTSLAWLALDPNLTAQQPRDFAADRQPEPSPAKFAARRPIFLLERLEDETLLLARDADTRILNCERNHHFRLIQRAVRKATTLFRPPNR